MGKETVLALLLREKGHFVSGEAVSAELGITRGHLEEHFRPARAGVRDRRRHGTRLLPQVAARHADRADRAQLLGTCRNRRQAHRLL